MGCGDCRAGCVGDVPGVDPGIWILVSYTLVPCIIYYGIVSGGSDHDGTWARLDLSKAATDNEWEYR